MSTQSAAAEVTLREITSETVRLVTDLAVAPEQEGYVASNAVSIAEAYFEPKAWFRAIAAGEELVGFVMVHRDPVERVFYVWRFMVDARYQGRGYARRAMELVLEEARSDAVPEVTLSVVPGEHSAVEFYRCLGFEETGELHGSEIVMRLELNPSKAAPGA